MGRIAENLKSIKARIIKSAERAGRHPEEIQLVAVTKTVDIPQVKELIEASQTIIGENRVQEARRKADLLKDYEITWHLIGHLQTNKVKHAVPLFDMIHSVDSLKLAEHINNYAAKIEKIQSILLEVNISEENSKFGLETGETVEIVKNISEFPNIKLEGLMTMAPFVADPEETRPIFRGLRELRVNQLSNEFPELDLPHLSMGMTNDFEVAVEEGATLVRIGTALYE